MLDDKISSKFLIEKNIAMPKSRGKWQQLVDDMEVGDSVKLRSYAQAKSFVASIHRNGGKAVKRQVENGWRVWLKSKSEQSNKGENNV